MWHLKYKIVITKTNVVTDHKTINENVLYININDTHKRNTLKAIFSNSY